MRRTSAFVAVVAAAAALLCPSAAFALDSAEGRAIDSLNEIRTSRGLAPLRASKSLANSANAYSRRMLAEEFFGHQASIQLSSKFRTAGETLAWHSGWQPGPGRTVRRWMASPPHRAILLSSAFRMVGMGMEKGRLGGRHATMWVAHFGRR
jgi:uncharacterized protein YkwD